MGKQPTAGDNLTVRNNYSHGFTTNAANGISTQSRPRAPSKAGSSTIPSTCRCMRQAPSRSGTVSGAQTPGPSRTTCSPGGSLSMPRLQRSLQGFRERKRVADSAAAGQPSPTSASWITGSARASIPMVLQITDVTPDSGGHGSFAADGRRTSEGPPTCGMSAEASARATWCWRPPDHRPRRAGRMRESEYESGGARRSDYATDCRSTGLALSPAFRATVMTSVAIDMPMRLLGT